MNFKQTALRVAALAAMAAGIVPAAHATNGYFPHGFGLKAKGMGGASVAMTHDAFAGVNNPAQSAFVGNRYDVGAEIFMPKREASVGPSPSVQSEKETFLIPEFGYNVGLSDQLGVGIAVYGNGGMNTQYPAFPNGMNLFGGTGQLGVDLIQLIVAPTIAYKLSDNHSVGVSPLLVYQVFKAYGLDGMGLPNQGTDSSTGLGVRLGYMGKIGDTLTVGASYSPKVNMSRFDKYANLFAEGGDFDIPENYAVGVAVQVTPSVLVAADYSRINYNKVASIGNSIMDPEMGFGWKNVNVLKLGVQWQASSQWTLRAGINNGTNPVSAPEAFLNVLAPGVIKTHITLGGTYARSANEELSFALWHGKRSNVSTATAIMPMGTMPVSLGMSQNGVGLQYSRKF